MSSNLIYTHKHHVIPKHQRGKCPLLDLIINDKSNLIALTVPEHAEAHRVLYEEFGNEFDRLASLSLSGCIGKEEIQVLISSEAGKKMTGKKHTEETKKKMSLAQKGRKLPPRTEEHRKNHSLAMTGKNKRPCTEEHKRKISLAKTGVIRTKSPCPRCGRLLDAGNMTRHLNRKVSCYNKWNFTECL